MQVGDVLRKKNARVVTIRMNETVGIAARLMRANNISALVVKDVVHSEGNTATGMFTERDVVRAIAEHGTGILPSPVSETMTRKVVTCGQNETIAEIMGRMTAGKFRHVPVVEQGRLIGIVSIGDIVKARLEELEQEHDALRDYIRTA